MTSSNLLILLIIAFIAYSMMKKSESFGIDYGLFYGSLIPPLESEVNILAKNCNKGGYRQGTDCDQYDSKSAQLTSVRILASGGNPFQQQLQPKLGFK